MKVLISCAEVRTAIGAGKREFIVPQGAIITAAARDIADQARVRLVTESQVGQVASIATAAAAVDPSGVRLIRGDTVRQEPFNTGNPYDRVTIKEILTAKESPMCSGFMTMEKSEFSWDLKYSEIDLIVEGSLDITVNGKTYHGKKGDVFFISQNTTVTFGCSDWVKFFFVTYPANWAELSNYKAQER